MNFLPRRWNTCSILAAYAALGGLGATSALATPYIWSSSAGSNSWATPSNWSGNQAPPVNGLATSDIFYNSAAAVFPDLGSAYGIRSLVFGTTASGYRFTTGSLTLGTGGITQSSAATEIFAIPVSLGAASTWTLGTGSVGALTFSAGLALGSNDLTISATGSGTIDGVISGTGNLIKTGSGTLTLTGASTFATITAINAGTLALGNGGSLVGTVVVGVGATLVVGGGGSVNQTDAAAQLVVDGTPAGPGTLLLNEGGSVVSRGGLIGNGSGGVFTQSGGSFDSGVVFSVGIGVLNGASGAYHLNGGTFSGFAHVGYHGEGTFNQTGGTAFGGLFLGTFPDGKSTVNLSGGILRVASLVGGPGPSIVNFNGGTVQPRVDTDAFVQGLTVANVRGGAVIDTNGFNVTVAQPLLHSTLAGDPATDGGLTKLGAGTLTLTGANTYTGETTIKAGTLSVANDGFLGGGKVVTILSSAALAFTDAAVSTARIYNLVSATLAPASGGTLTYANGAAVSGGTLGAGNHGFGGNVSLNGVRVGAGASLSQASGTLSLNNVTFSGSSTFTQATNGTVNSTGDLTVHPPSTLTINGVCNVAGGYLSGGVTVSATGRLNESGGTTPLYLDGSRGVTIQAGGRLAAAGGSTIELGGLLTNNGTQTGVLNVNLGGVVRGNGTFGTVNLLAASTFSASGSVGGMLTISAGALVSVDGSGKTLTVAGQFVNNGTMRFTNGARLQVTSPANQVVNAGIIDVISGQLALPAGFVNNGVVIDSSVVRVKQISRPAGAVAVQIDGYPGHTYRLQRRASLTSGTFADVPGSDPQANPASATTVVTLTFTDANPAAGEGFYRVVVDA